MPKTEAFKMPKLVFKMPKMVFKFHEMDPRSWNSVLASTLTSSPPFKTDEKSENKFFHYLCCHYVDICYTEFCLCKRNHGKADNVTHLIDQIQILAYIWSACVTS